MVVGRGIGWSLRAWLRSNTLRLPQEINGLDLLSKEVIKAVLLSEAAQPPPDPSSSERATLTERANGTAATALLQALSRATASISTSGHTCAGRAMRACAEAQLRASYAAVSGSQPSLEKEGKTGRGQGATGVG